MKVALVRGAYLNNFEGQNYSNLGKSIKVTAISSLKPLHRNFRFAVIKRPSLSDLGFPTWLANRTFGDRQMLFGLEKAVKEFDIVHTADPHYYYSYQMAKLRKKKKLKCLISTSWETIPFNNESTIAKKRIKRFTMKYVDRFICYSKRAKKCLTKEGVNPKKISVIRLGVDLSKFKVLSSKFKINQYENKKVRVLFVGRDVPEKGLSDLRAAIKQCDNSTNIELLVAGKIPYEQMPEVYQLADIFAMPSKTTKTWEEQYGMVLIEAMASGLPILAYGSGAIPELLGRAGALAKEGSIDKLTKALESLVASPEKRRKLGYAAGMRAKKLFDSRNFSLELRQLYKQVYFSL